MDPHDLQARVSRWGLALGEITAAIKEVHATLEAVGIRDTTGEATVEVLRLVAARAAPPPELVVDDGDDGEPVLIVTR